jgi:hypothetical protein
MSLTNLLKVTGIAVRTPVIAQTTPIAVMLAAIEALIDVAKRYERRFGTAVGAITKLLIV